MRIKAAVSRRLRRCVNSPEAPPVSELPSPPEPPAYCIQTRQRLNSVVKTGSPGFIRRGKCS